jgi:hypothetical protein
MMAFGPMFWRVRWRSLVNVGDLVEFNPRATSGTAGALTAVKFFERMKKRIDGKIGMITHTYPGKNCVVLFENDSIVLNIDWLVLVSRLNER